MKSDDQNIIFNMVLKTKNPAGFELTTLGFSGEDATIGLKMPLF